MKLKRFISLGLSLIMMLSSANIVFAENEERFISEASNDIIVSEAAIKVYDNEGVSEFEEERLNNKEIVIDTSDFITQFEHIISVSNMPVINKNYFIGNINTMDDVSVIENAEQLANIKSGSYVLVNDIDLSTYNDGNWTPITLDEDIVLDGQGHTIFGLNCSSTGYNGFIGSAKNVTIKNLMLYDVDISKKGRYSAAFVACGENVEILNSVAIGNIQGSKFTGGLVGYANDFNAEESYFNGSILASNHSAQIHLGGLCGWINGTMKVNRCFVVGDCKSTGFANAINVGGLVGYGNGTINKCFFNGNVSNSRYGYAGGFIGYTYSSNISNSCDFGEVKTIYDPGQGGYAGGLIAYSYNRSYIENCYTMNKVIAINSDTGEESTNQANPYIGFGKRDITDSYTTAKVVGTNGSCIVLASTRICKLGENNANWIIGTLTPHTNDKSDIVWTSSNPNVVEVIPSTGIDGISSDSLWCNLNCKAVGTSIITVSNSKGASASCLVTVTEPKLEVVSTKIDATTKNGKINANDGDLFEGLDYSIKFNTPITLLDESKITICKVDNINDGDVLLNNVTADRECYVDETDNTVLHIYQNYRSVESNPNIKNDYKSYINAHSIPLNTDLCVLIDKTAIKAIDENYQFNGILDSSLRFATTSGIEFFKDTYNFVHSSDCFFNNNEEQHHNLSDKAASLLKENGISSKTIDNERYVKTWNGSCAGLTVLASLIKNGFISTNDVVYNADTVFDFSAPRNNTATNGLRDKIEYYYEFYNYLAKKTTRYKTNEYTNSDGKKVKVKNADTKYNEVLKEIVDRYSDVDVTKEYPTTEDIIIRIGFYGNNQLHGHTILPYNLIEEDNRYVVYCYDVNQLTTPLKLYISKDLGSISFSNSTYNDWVYIGYVNLSEFLEYSLFATEITEDMNNKDELAYFTINSSSNYCITDGDKTINVVNGKLSGDVDVIEYMDIEGGGTEFSADYILGLPQKNNFRIVCESGNANFEYIKGNMYLYLEAKNISEITINDSNKVNIKGSELEYNMSISSNLTDNSLISLKGNSESYIGIDYIDNNANIKTDSLENTNAKLIVSGDITEIKEFASGEEIKVSDNRFVETAESTSVETTVVTESSTESTTETIVTTETATVTITEAITETTTIELKETTTETTTASRPSSSGGGGGGSSRRPVTTTTTTVSTTEATTETTTNEATEVTTEGAINTDVKITIGKNEVEVGNKVYVMDAAAYIQTSSNSTMVPLRFVALAIIGDDVEKADTSKLISWDATTKTATITVNNKSIEFTAGSDKMIVDGISTTMEYGVKAEIKDSRMFIPFRALGKALGVNVDWDADTKTAIYKVK